MSVISIMGVFLLGVLAALLVKLPHARRGFALIYIMVLSLSGVALIYFGDKLPAQDTKTYVMAFSLVLSTLFGVMCILHVAKEREQERQEAERIAARARAHREAAAAKQEDADPAAGDHDAGK